VAAVVVAAGAKAAVDGVKAAADAEGASSAF
jgi:hypothetical protein